MHHRVSKSASEDFWRLASREFPKLSRARTDEMVYKKIPQFQILRKNLYKAHVPPISLKIAYQDLDTDEITVVEGQKTPVSQFSPSKYRKLYEIATVKVSILNKVIYDLDEGSASRHKSIYFFYFHFQTTTIPIYILIVLMSFINKKYLISLSKH